MSPIALAEAIDRLVETKQAYISESESTAIVSSLLAANASEITEFCKLLDWSIELFDGADELWDITEAPHPDFAPFRAVIHKPAATTNTLQLLSNYSFAQWLEKGHAAPCWHIARFEGSLVTGLRVIQPWDGRQEPAAVPTTKSPRALVKELGDVRRVPEDVRCWLASALEIENFAQPATQVWVRAASEALISCLPDEIDAADSTLKFRGPPRLTLPKFDATADVLDQVTFNTLLKTSQWVFENEREAEMRHILLAAELARSGTADQSISTFLSENLAHAWESAQIAYQMALAETGRDTLKALSDLRKAVTEETSKLSDTSRQLANSVAAAVATGIGLIAARVAANAPAEIVVVLMAVIALYIAVVISSGVQFMRLQRQLRAEWQHRLYRFLPEAEYMRMVVTPTGKAESSFIWTAWLGGATVGALTLLCVWVTLVPQPTTPKSKDISQSTVPLAQPSSTATGEVGPGLPQTSTTSTTPATPNSPDIPRSPPRK